MSPLRTPRTRLRALPDASRLAIREARAVAEVTRRPRTIAEARAVRASAAHRVLHRL